MAVTPKIPIDKTVAEFVSDNTSFLQNVADREVITTESQNTEGGLFQSIQARITSAFVNVFEHGVTGSGDDTAAMQTAFTFGGDAVYFIPPGSYTLTGNITATSGSVVFAGGVTLTGGTIVSSGSLILLGLGGISLDSEELTLRGQTITPGAGDPEGVKTAPIGSLFLRSDGGTDTSVYRKESGVGNTGWVPISNIAGSAHALGGAQHLADTLANLNTKVSDATLDDSGDSRPPDAHALGGAAHTADTLANLNTKVSDATLDDSGDARPPTAHTHAHADTTGQTEDDHHDRSHDIIGASDHSFPGGTTTFLRSDGVFAVPISGGGVTALLYSFSTIQTAGNPGAGTLRFNAGTYAGTTEIYINDVAQHPLFDIGVGLTELQVGDLMSFAELDDPASAAIFTIVSVVDNTGWFTITVTAQQDGGGNLIANGGQLWISTFLKIARPHNLDEHGSSSLAEFNAILTGGQVDDENDPRPPTAHTHAHADTTGQTADDHHNQTHSIIGGDHNGFPGGATTFLRDDGTFAAVPGAAHALGGAQHTSDTLANLNSKVSDATLDDSGDSRPPDAHALGGAAHTADTLANLNTKVSDATLDDAGDSRPPDAHALGGSAHSADTLANLNTKVSDATLLNLAGQLGGTAASPDVRGVRESGSTLLAMGAVADTEFLARDGTSLVGKVVTPFPVVFHRAQDMNSALTADAAVNGNAPLVTDDNNSVHKVRLSDADVEEGFLNELFIPVGATSMTIDTSARALTTPAGAVTALARIYFRQIVSGGAWNTAEDLTDIDLSTNENFVEDTTTQTLVNWNVTAGDTFAYQVTRNAATVGDDLLSDLAWKWVRFSFA